MRSTEAALRFPVLGFTPDGEIWGFEDLNTLTSCGPRTLREDLQLGMELIDSNKRRWIVRSIRRIGRGEPLVLWLISCLISTRQSRIEQELDELEPVSLDTIRERACASVEKNSSDYGAYDDNKEKILKPLLAKVRSAKSIARIHELLGLDSFMAY